MTYNEIYNEFLKLTPAEQGRFVDEARQRVKRTNTNLLSGAKVSFRSSKSGVMIQGTFIRMKHKYAEVESKQDKYGIPTQYALRWSVPPEMLRVES
jgi:hypothetical protein